MSIAMTVVVASSRRLRCLLAGFGASMFAAAWAAGSSAFSHFTAGPAVAAALLFAGVCVTHAALRPATVHRIDISGPGQLRLTVQQGLRPEKRGALPVRLLPGSTLWPRLLLLRLEASGDGRALAATERARPWWARRWNGMRRPARYSIAVLPDSLPPDAFRALAVALGAQAMAASGAAGERKIL